MLCVFIMCVHVDQNAPLQFRGGGVGGTCTGSNRVVTYFRCFSSGAHICNRGSLHAHVHGQSLRIWPLRVSFCRTSYIFDPVKAESPSPASGDIFKNITNPVAHQRSPASCCAKADSELSDVPSQHLIESLLSSYSYRGG